MSAVTAAVPVSRPPLALRAVQLVMTLLGTVSGGGALYFTVVSPLPGTNTVGYAVGAWALVTALALVVAAARLGAGGYRFALRVLAVHVAFGLVKLGAYHEGAAVPFLAVDVLLIAALLRLSRR